MQDFDSKTYNRQVLAKYRSGGKPDEFERYLLDLSDEDERQIEDRLETVKRFWNNQKTQPAPIGPLVTTLLGEHAKMIAQLGDRDGRADLRARIDARRAQAHAALWAPVDRALEQIFKRYGGIPEQGRLQVVDLGRSGGLAADEVDAHIAATMRQHGWTIVSVQEVTDVEPLPEAKARQIRQVLERFGNSQAQATGDSNPAPTRSIFGALGLQMDAEPPECAAAIDALNTRLNTQVRRDSDYAGAGRNLLELARGNLGNDTIGQYRATIVREAQAALTSDFTASAMDGAIDQREFAELLTKAAELGLTDRYARSVLDLLFKAAAEQGRNVSRIEGERVEILACTSCQKVDAIGSGHRDCLGCGAPLYRGCGSCKKDVPRGEAVCRYCGHSMLRAIQVDIAIRAGRQALVGGRPDQATRQAAAAIALDGGSAEARQLLAEGEAQLQKAALEWSATRDQLGQRRLYAARATLQGLVNRASDVEDGGEDPSEALSGVNAELAQLDVSLAEARSKDGLQRERLLAGILARAVDCSEAQRALSMMAPQPPADVEVYLGREDIEIRWGESPSPGVSEYVVIRSEERAVTDPSRGDRVPAHSMTAAVDGAVLAGTRVVYAVFASRAGAFSTEAASAPLVAAFEATDVRTTVGSGEVRLNWQLRAGDATVHLERSDDSGMSVALHAGADGYVDTAVTNGQVYRYLVRVRYGNTLTKGVEVAAAPADPPRAVSLTDLQASVASVVITWVQPPQGNVTIIRSVKRLEIERGGELRRHDLAPLGTLLPGAGGTATDPSPVDGLFYTPVTVVGDRAVIGSGLRWSDIPAITDVRAIAAGVDVTVSWSWPDGVRHAVVLWREGAAPEGLDDPSANRQKVSRVAQQEVGGGVFRIPREQPAVPLRVAVYSAQMRDGELLVGARLAPSSRASVDPASTRRPISYDLKLKGGFRSKALTLTLDGGDGLPEIVLVVKPGDVIPFSADDGKPIARIGGGGPPEVVVALSSLPKERPLAVRAFLASDGARATYSLREPADLTKLILR